jgi:hypothetical protein
MTEQEWLACTDPQKLLAFLGGKASERKLRLFYCACCRRTWPLLKDKRSRQAVEVAEQFADGLADRGVRSTTRRAASYATSVAWRALQRASEEVFPQMRDMVPPFEAALTATYALDSNLNGKAIAWRAAQAVGVATDGIPITPAEGEATRKERRSQADLLRDICGNPFRPLPSIDPTWLAWNNGTVVKLAQTIYDQRELPTGTLDATRLAVLADALEDAGCTDANILDHLRGPGPHVRGCWALDLLLGKG